MTIRKTTLAAAAVLVGLAGAAGTAQAGSLETLERERASLIETMLSPAIPAHERHGKAAQAKTRLADLERIVLRDKSLAEQNTPVVRKAFENYDLTFLVHASAEKDTALVDHWLEQVKITTSSLMHTRVGRR